MTEEAVLETIAVGGVLPVVTLDDPAIVGALCAALLAGGIGCIEITFRTEAALAAVREAARVEGMLVGVGTVVAAEQAQAAAKAGASFAVAPGTDDEVVSACRRLGLPFFPGIATPSELGHALRLGRTTVKVFPASTLGGPGFLRAISATFPQARFIPTGGIDAESLPSYLTVPSVVACGGSWICDKQLLVEHRFDEVTRRARSAVEARP